MTQRKARGIGDRRGNPPAGSSRQHPRRHREQDTSDADSYQSHRRPCPHQRSDQHARNRPEQKAAQKRGIQIPQAEVSEPGDQGKRDRVRDVGAHQAPGVETDRVQVNQQHRSERPGANRGQSDQNPEHHTREDRQARLPDFKPPDRGHPSLVTLSLKPVSEQHSDRSHDHGHRHRTNDEAIANLVDRRLAHPKQGGRRRRKTSPSQAPNDLPIDRAMTLVHRDSENLRDRGKNQVRTHRGLRGDTKQQNQDRRHQRATANAGDPYNGPHQESGQHVGQVELHPIRSGQEGTEAPRADKQLCRTSSPYRSLPLLNKPNTNPLAHRVRPGFPSAIASDSAMKMLVILPLLAVLQPAKPIATDAGLLSVQRIGDTAPHCAFTDLVRWHDQFWCVFREGTAHVSPDGAIRVLSSADGTNWISAARLTSPRGDLRDPHVTVTPDGSLMLYGAAALPQPGPVKHQSLVWFSTDGRQWSQEAPIGDPNVWMWRVAWRGPEALGVGYDTDGERFVRLYSSRDGRRFDTEVPTLFSDPNPNEAGLAYLPDGTCLCLLRRDGQPGTGKLGMSRPPYRDWTWKDLGVRIGGPQLLRLPDGRLVAAGRLYDGGARTALCWLDTETARLSEFLKLPGGGDCSYPGLVWHDGILWVSYYSSHSDGTKVYLARVRLPGASEVPKLSPAKPGP